MAGCNLLLVLVVLVAAVSAASNKPHIIFILSDDYGWANVGYHTNNTEVVTPNLNALHSVGIELDRHYVYQVCSPTRSALLSGRNPIHVNVYNLVQNYNPANNVTGFAGIPLRMTLVSEKLKQAGYTTRHSGKWDVGFATKHHLAVNRGFDSSFGYLQHANDYWGYNASCGAIDLWSGNTPAYNNSPAANCAFGSQAGCENIDELLVNRVLNEIGNHDASKPLFYYWAMHSVHNPMQPLDSYYSKFSSVDVSQRRQLAAMVNYMDDNIGRVVDLLKAKGMWDNTLIVWSSDNGGPVNSLKVAATNFPLRGGKTTNWEGGIRVNAFVSGGLVPTALRGTKNEDFVAIWDWYTTFCGLAGVDATDTSAAANGLPPIDGHDIWPLLTKQNTTNPRTELPIGLDNDGEPGVNVVVQGIIVPPYKLLLGKIPIAWWQGYVFPNATTNIKQLNALPAANCTRGCLYNIMEDPGETTDISAANPEVVTRLLARIDYHQSTVFAADRGQEDPQACVNALSNYNGFMGPWVEIAYDTTTTTTTTAAATTTTTTTTAAAATTSTAAGSSTASTQGGATSGAASTAAGSSTTGATTKDAATTRTPGTTDTTTEHVTSGATQVFATLACFVVAWLAL